MNIISRKSVDIKNGFIKNISIPLGFFKKKLGKIGIKIMTKNTKLIIRF